MTCNGATGPDTGPAFAPSSFDSVPCMRKPIPPSTSYINPRKNLFYRHGCGGDLIRLVELSQHLFFRQSVLTPVWRTRALIQDGLCLDPHVFRLAQECPVRPIRSSFSS
jgi:hypothetical protein